jgi:hypothetical protein
LISRMAMGSSTVPRAQAVSQGWVQTRPQTTGSGLSRRITAKGLFVAALGDEIHVALHRDARRAGHLAGALAALSMA